MHARGKIMNQCYMTKSPKNPHKGHYDGLFGGYRGAMHRASQSPQLRGTNADRYGSLIGAWLASYDSANTQAAYRSDTRTLVRHLDAHDTDLLQVRRRDLDLFARTQRHEGASASTLARRLACVSAFYRYAVLEGHLETNPADHLRRPRVDADQTTTAALTRREAEDLLLTAMEHSTRAHALVDLLLCTGIRITEALTATEAGLSSDRLSITRKGGTSAVVFLPDHTAEALRALTGATGDELACGTEDDRLLFTTSTGRPWDRTDAARTITRLAERAGITQTVTPHVLRHTHATLALELGVSLHHLQDSLGHKDPRTTRRYDHARTRLENSSAHAVGRLLS